MLVRFRVHTHRRLLVYLRRDDPPGPFEKERAEFVGSWYAAREAVTDDLFPVLLDLESVLFSGVHRRGQIQNTHLERLDAGVRYVAHERLLAGHLIVELCDFAFELRYTTSRPLRVGEPFQR